jgi:hypothetical protein
MEEAAVAPIGRPGPEDSKAPVAPTGGPSSEAPVIEGSSATDLDDANSVYDRTCFRKYKAHCRFKDDYNKCRVAVERGLVVADFDEHPPCIRTMLKP